MTEELAGILIGGGVALLCLVLGIILTSGHGAMLISGYNMTSEKERETWNQKALCRAVGGYLLVTAAWVAALLAVSVRGINGLIFPLVAFYMLGTIASLIYRNKSKRFRK